LPYPAFRILNAELEGGKPSPYGERPRAGWRTAAFQTLRLFSLAPRGPRTYKTGPGCSLLAALIRRLGTGGSLEGYIHFGITAGCGCIHSGYDPFNVAAQSRPLLIADNHERDFPALQVLLVTQVLVSGQQKLETCRLRSGDQFAVKKPVPPSFHGFNYPMAMERLPERGGSTVIKEYEHQPLGRGGCTGSASRLRAANLITATTCSWDK